MNAEVTECLQAISQNGLFWAAGQRVAQCARLAQSWDEVYQLCAAPEWEDMQTGASNMLGQIARANNPTAHEKWNDITKELRPIVRKVVADSRVVVAAPKVFGDSVTWDLLLSLMSLQLSTDLPNAYCAKQRAHYVAGHVTCGWLGIFPNGDFVVY